MEVGNSPVGLGREVPLLGKGKWMDGYKYKSSTSC